MKSSNFIESFYSQLKHILRKEVPPVTLAILIFPALVAMITLIPSLRPGPYFLELVVVSYLTSFVFIEYPMRNNKLFSLHLSYRMTLYVLVLFNMILYVLAYNYLGLPGVPVFLGSGLIALLFGPRLGAFSAVYQGIVMAYVAGMSIRSFAWLVAVGALTAFLLREVFYRSTVAKTALYTSLVNIGWYALNRIGVRLEPVFSEALIAALNPLICSVILIGLLPYVEITSRIYSNIGLTELGNLSHPLLKLLSMKAPGTYYHSVLMANIAEMAAESIGANPVLARTASYYHDVGKVKRPEYFSENQSGAENPHEKLSPWVSNLVLNEHVKYGVELARKYRLPLLVEDVVLQHHGTRPKLYFLHKARELDASVNDAEFRYPGVKPQFKESGIIMLADSVEAAVRSIEKPRMSRIREVVEDIVNAVYNERELDESGLTLKDLELIIEAFTKTLSSMYHERVSYPDLEGKESTLIASERNDNGNGSKR
ncbi:MAG: cyclic-di-AMP phosphodiesterase PgpH [Thermotogota bacterium]|nr:cyclic-di-AMP phosphodiesterase PgpH [Thermotogota bacterium]MDK2863916.1 cyclic-di-AMP phosphodiesterase PgpH [Thermotogota bacterium]